MKSLLLLSISALFIVFTASANTGVPEPTWPKLFDYDGNTQMLMYQPQVEAWPDYRQLEARFAVSIKLPARLDEIPGTVQVSVATTTDFSARLVALDNFQISRVYFPGLDDSRAASMEMIVRRAFAEAPFTVELDRLLANLDRAQNPVRTITENMLVPQLLVSDGYGILVLIDGEPVFESIADTGLQVVLNTPLDLVRDQNGTYYLITVDGWFISEGLNGSWSKLEQVPDAFRKLPDEEQWQTLQQAVKDFKPWNGELPQIYVSQEPSELVMIDGKPQFDPVPGTNLLFMSNTDSSIFVDKNLEGDFFILLSGRWFKTPGLDKPLQYVGDRLPAEFSKIPEDHPAGRVLASVPGTLQAQEAVLGAQIPRIARVNRNTTGIEVNYDGDPLFEPIPGTQVTAAVNTSFDVFRVKDQYYVLHDAVWFVGSSPHGPWKVADNVPSEIYQIPPSHPQYYVTYVRVYGSTAGHVDTGYESGYLGTFIVGGLLVYGIANADYVHVRACSGCYGRYRHAYHRRHHRRHHRHHVHPVYRARPYGSGHRYDHLTGGFARSNASARLTGTATIATSPYAVWGNDKVRATTVKRRGKSMAGSTSRAIVVKPDLYAGRDGNVYRKTNNDWQKYDKGGWRNAAKDQAPKKAPAARVGTSEYNDLQRAARARSAGATRPTQYNSYRASGAGLSVGRRGRGRR